MLKHLPIIVRLSDKEVKQSDLMRELRIDHANIDRQLARQPGRYAYWSQLYATIAAKVSKYKEDLESLEADVFTDFLGTVTEKRTAVKQNREYKELKAKLRRWENAERHAKFAERALEHKLSVLMALNANQRRERDRS